jgi:hypothetical protein
MKNYAHIARVVNWYNRVRVCETVCSIGIDLSAEALAKIRADLPSGSGIDSGTELDPYECKPDRLVFSLGFHHMDENGFYDGWTQHQVILKPSLENGFDMRITGKDRNQIKEYLYQVYDSYFNSETLEP